LNIAIKDSPGNSTTECYEYLKPLIFLIYLIMTNTNEAEAIGKYVSPIRYWKDPANRFYFLEQEEMRLIV